MLSKACWWSFSGKTNHTTWPPYKVTQIHSQGSMANGAQQHPLGSEIEWLHNQKISCWTTSFLKFLQKSYIHCHPFWNSIKICQNTLELKLICFFFFNLISSSYNGKLFLQNLCCTPWLFSVVRKCVLVGCWCVFCKSGITVLREGQVSVQLILHHQHFFDAQEFDRYLLKPEHMKKVKILSRITVYFSSGWQVIYLCNTIHSFATNYCHL